MPPARRRSTSPPPGPTCSRAWPIDADVVGVDATQSLAHARARLPSTAVQGNLDPSRLGADWTVVAAGVDAVLAANDGRPGHIFNTGHAVPRDTDPDRLRDVVRLVHDRTAAAVPASEVLA